MKHPVVVVSQKLIKKLSIKSYSAAHPKRLEEKHLARIFHLPTWLNMHAHWEKTSTQANIIERADYNINKVILPGKYSYRFLKKEKDG